MRRWCTSWIYFFVKLQHLKVRLAFAFRLQTLWLIDFTKIFQLKGLKLQTQRPHELLWMLRFDKKVYLMYFFASAFFMQSNLVWGVLFSCQKTKRTTKRMTWIWLILSDQSMRGQYYVGQNSTFTIIRR